MSGERSTDEIAERWCHPSREGESLDGELRFPLEKHDPSLALRIDDRRGGPGLAAYRHVGGSAQDVGQPMIGRRPLVGPCVGAGGEENDVTVVGRFDAGLNRGHITGTVGFDGPRARCDGNGREKRDQKGCDEGKTPLLHGDGPQGSKY